MSPIEQIASDQNKMVIWGARMTGLGLMSKLIKMGSASRVECFIDSDPAFNGRRLFGRPVLTPAAYFGSGTGLQNNRRDITVVIAVALKEAEIRRALKRLNIKAKIIGYTQGDQSHVTIDIMGACNLRCGSCPQGIPTKDVPKGAMSLENFYSVINKVKVESPETTHIALYSWGDPFLHPRLPEMIDAAHDANFAVALSTNLSIESNIARKLDTVVARAPEYIKISVSGYTQSVYGQTHQGGSISLVKSNLHLLRYYLDQQENCSTLVDINYHLYQNNLEQDLEKFRALADELGFIFSTTDSLLMPTERVLDLIDGYPDDEAVRLDKDLFLLPTLKSIEISAMNTDPLNECPFAVNQLNINSDLTVPVCCTVFGRDETIVSNNFLEDSLTDIMSRKSQVQICKRCISERLPEYNLGYNQLERQQEISSRWAKQQGERGLIASDGQSL